MNAYKFFNKVEEGDIIVLREDLKVGESYGAFTYFSSMPKPGESLEYELQTSTGGFVVTTSEFHLSPEMVDHIVKSEKNRKEEVTPEKIESLIKEFQQTRASLERLQKEFDRIKELLESIGKYE